MVPQIPYHHSFYAFLVADCWTLLLRYPLQVVCVLGIHPLLPALSTVSVVPLPCRLPPHPYGSFSVVAVGFWSWF